MASNSNFKKTGFTNEEDKKAWCLKKGIEYLTKEQYIAKMNSQKKQEVKKVVAKKPFVSTTGARTSVKRPFKDLTQDEKKAWFEKKGIEYKEFKPFNEWSDEEKRVWFEKKGIKFVPREEYLANKRREKAGDYIEEPDCDMDCGDGDASVFSAADFGMDTEGATS